MDNEPLLSHPLKNGLTLVCKDQSKKIAADRWFVSIIINIFIPVEKKWLDGFSLNEEKKNQICEKLGDAIIFNQIMERNFISEDVKESIVNEICENARTIGDDYFSHEKFPGKYMLKVFTEKKGTNEIC